METNIVQDTDLTNKRLIVQAIQGGATAAKIINASDVFVAQWVRQKCHFGCRHFGQRFSCPPYAPTPQETVETVKQYRQALLVEFGNRHIDDPDVGPKRDLIHHLLYELERQAFLDRRDQALARAKYLELH
ncbi:MAG: metal-binding protein-like protein [Dehalococcoidia bacterium]|nr:metal-binding protein-like protein [Dehalococcoidia bacterium]